MKYEITAKRLRNALSENNLTAQELAKLSGVSKASISQYVNGTHRPSIEASRKIATVLKTDPFYLMGYSEKKVEKPDGEVYTPLVGLPEHIQKHLDRYREIYNEWQHYMEEKYNETFVDLSDNALLMIALDESIGAMHLLMADNRKHDKERGAEESGMCKI